MSSRNGGTVCTGFPDDIVQIPEGGGVLVPRGYTDKHNPGDAVCQKQATPYKNVRGDSGFYSRIFYEVKKVTSLETHSSLSPDSKVPPLFPLRHPCFFPTKINVSIKQIL